MVFSSALFLFIFLPIVIIGNLLLAPKFRNFFLLLSSLFFYAWGEGVIIILMISSICLNYIFGIGIEYFLTKMNNKNAAKLILVLAVLTNISFLIYYKYYGFILENIQGLGPFDNITISEIALPIGISFYTFQSLSYCIDVYRKEVSSQKNPLNLGLYISLFPQLIAGPIVRYHDIDKQITNRTIEKDVFVDGILQFVRGLVKKMIFANTAAIIADQTFAVAAENLPTSLAWIGILCYALQIYFDFSGYSDMALGLGKMFGFKFAINFDYPYISKSIQEFWRRWHISLSTWFRDYLYIPLGGSRGKKWTIYRNLIIVFLITGIWHGASWNFVIWGLFHGTFLILERVGGKKILSKMPTFLQHFYAVVVVLFGWVFFRSETLAYAMGYFKSMLGFTNGTDYTPFAELDNFVLTILILGVIIATPIRGKVINLVKEFESGKFFQDNPIYFGFKKFTILMLMVVAFVVCAMQIASNSYNPFIYFRF
ncbi:MBOAT family O-acyltransferase [Arenibacter sp. M-2]|uniref:MBOAT family O-acyltransferase n=1 Tax=Arenibacter sp. M-2 TaxID=3053612 RepID=UPI002570D0F1|nr:MBOAT family O-acyltransferase [Arenibacter sp. M-2]MDL5510258.1 MBOAT family O-acyltransferase [Arenibacter sp. M-2]